MYRFNNALKCCCWQTFILLMKAIRSVIKGIKICKIYFQHMGLSGQKLSPEELFDAVTKRYVRYSSSTNSLISFNYCILPELAPKWARHSLKSFLSPFCQNWIFMHKNLFRIIDKFQAILERRNFWARYMLLLYYAYLVLQFLNLKICQSQKSV